MEKEKRNYELEVRADTDKGHIEGYALMFDTESRDLGGFVEVIKPTALEGVLKRSDVLAVLNHNEDKAVFARSRYGKGSLHLEVDDKGLRYWFKVGKSAAHQELAEMIERGDIFSSSFAFTIAPEGDQWEKRDDGKYLRTITQFDELYDVSPVYRPAYESTTVGTRAMTKLEELRKEDKKPDNKETEGVEKLNKEFERYYKKLEKKYLYK